MGVAETIVSNDTAGAGIMLPKSAPIGALLCLSMGFLSTVASAEVLTFEGYANTVFSAPTTQGTFTVGNVAGDQQHFHLIDSAAFPTATVSNGTGVLYNDPDTRIFIQLTGGGLFTLGAFDGSGTRTTSSATSLLVQGYLGSTLVASTTYSISATSFTTFSGLSGVFDRVVFDGLGGAGAFQLDNVTVNAAGVPESSTWTMMLLGFGGIGMAVRRSRKPQTSRNMKRGPVHHAPRGLLGAGL